MKIANAKIIKGIGGFYYVEPADSAFLDKIIECKPRGIFRHQGIKPVVGDSVEIQQEENGRATRSLVKS